MNSEELKRAIENERRRQHEEQQIAAAKEKKLSPIEEVVKVIAEFSELVKDDSRAFVSTSKAHAAIGYVDTWWEIDEGSNNSITIKYQRFERGLFGGFVNMWRTQYIEQFEQSKDATDYLIKNVFTRLTR